MGEDRLVLDSKGLFELVDFFLPCSVDQDVIDAKLNRNDDVSTYPVSFLKTCRLACLILSGM